MPSSKAGQDKPTRQVSLATRAAAAYATVPPPILPPSIPPATQITNAGRNTRRDTPPSTLPTPHSAASAMMSVYAFPPTRFLDMVLPGPVLILRPQASSRCTGHQDAPLRPAVPR